MRGRIAVIGIGLCLMGMALALPTEAAVFWDDELETGNTGYGLPGGFSPPAMVFDTSVKFSGNGSLRYDFNANCYPDSSAQSNCGGFTDRTFTPTANFYRRLYMRLSGGFTVSDVFTKLFRSDTTGPNSNWWTLGCCGQLKLIVGNQNVPSIGATMNNYTNYTMPTNQWVCVETYEQLNTPGVANGVQRAWVDGVLVLDTSGIMFRQSGDNSLYNNNRLYRQTGLGSIWFDRMAAGDTRIGCVGGTTDTTPPAPPANFKVQ